MEQNILIQVAQISPGIAGMGYLAWLANSRSNKSELHVQAIHDSFIRHIERKELDMAKEREQRDKMFHELTREHVQNYKAEQEAFAKTVDRLESKHI